MNLQISINNLSKALVKIATPLTLMLKTTGSSKVLIFRMLRVNHNKIVGSSSGRSIKKSARS